MFTKTLTTVLVFAAALTAETPIACNLKALTPAARTRHAALSHKLSAATLAKNEIANGLSFRLSLAGMSLQEIGEWIENERKCCPFLDFQLNVDCDGGAVHLALTGGPGVKDFLLSDFAKAGTRI